MEKQKGRSSSAQREAIWRDRLKRFTSSGQSAESFCRDESVSTASFYTWRKRLRECDDGDAAATPFVDLGMMAGIGERNTSVRRVAPPPMAAGIDVRLDLGGGIVLTIARH